MSWKANKQFTSLFLFSNIYSSTLYPFFQIFILAQVLDIIQKHHGVTMAEVAVYGILFAIVSLINIALTSLVNFQGFYKEVGFDMYIDKLIIQKLTTLDPQTFEKPSFQKLLAEVEAARGVLSAQIDRLTGFISAIAKTLTAIFVLLPLFPIFIPLILVSVVPAYYIGDVSRKRMWPFFTSKRTVVTRVTQYVKTLLSQDSTSKEASIFHTGAIMQHKVTIEQQKYLRDYKKINDSYASGILGANIFQFCVFLLTQYINLVAVVKGTLAVGQFTLAFQQSQNLATGSQGILDMYSSMKNRIQQIEKFFTFFDYQPAITSPQEPKILPTSPVPPIIEFKNVSFRYPKTERDILKNFNVILNSGEKIALVGENGAGKTTIIKLLLRFYDVTEGEILVNGINIKNLILEQWHSKVGALFQDFIKYQFTFKENIYYGNFEEKNNEDLLKDAIAKSGADKYLESLPDGVNQIVGKMFDSGIDLSGGQWQKLALARAFFRNAPILILDEPTAAIDAKAEYEIFENVQKLQKDKTVLIISHRFSTVRNADRILVLEDGKILEEGNHETLMKKKGLYAELFEIQAKGYK